MSSSPLPPLPPLPPLVRSIRDHLWGYAEDELRKNPEQQIAYAWEDGRPLLPSTDVWEYKVVRVTKASNLQANSKDTFERQTWLNGKRVS